MKHTVVKMVRLAVACALMAMFFAATVFAAPANEVTLQIVHVNDVHARVEKNGESIGYATIASLIRELRNNEPNTIVLDAGDTLHGDLIANLSQGENIIQIMNAVGFDAMVPGNHDFGYGYEQLVALNDLAEFPILAANIYKTDGTRLFAPYVINNIGGVDVAIFGLATPDTMHLTFPGHVQGLTFSDPVEEARNIVTELSDKADVIIALAHLGLSDDPDAITSTKIAEQVPDIDVIVDGHSHTVLESGLTVGDVLIVQSGEHGKHVGVVELTLNDQRQLTKKNASLLSLVDTDTIEPDTTVAALISELKAKTEEALSEVVGYATVHLDGETENIRTGETNLGNLVADVIRWKADADIALINSGSIRASIPASPITIGHVLSVAQHRNYIQTMIVKGRDIIAALEHGVSQHPKGFGGFLQVSGVTFELHPDEPGQRVRNVSIGDAPIDLNAEYLLATSNFLTSGGDSFSMLTSYPIAGEFGFIEDALIEYLANQGEISPQVEGRISVVSANDNGSEVEQQQLPEEQKVYIVRPGDNLYRIALRFGTTWQTLQQLNNIKNPHLIYPNQVINLP